MAPRTLLGYDQERWLFDGFRGSATTWNVLTQGQLVAQLRQKGQDGVAGHWTDGWDGYPAGRRRMLNAIASNGLSKPRVNWRRHPFVLDDRSKG
jgi:alkaline phosphatase D